MKSPNRQFLYGTSLFLGTIVVGFLVFWLAGWPALDAIYMVIITIFGVGYGEVNTMTPELRIFTIIFIVAGCTALIYTIGAFINWLTEGQLQRLLGERKMEKDIEQLSNHVVICGFGRIGRLLAEQLHSADRDFLIIDPDAHQIEQIRESGYLCIQGDATEETTLKKARLKQASIVATVIPNDAANVFIVLSCRQLNPELIIIARANQTSTESKLKQAGADKIVMPAAIGADRIAHLVLKPNAREILEKDLHDNAFVEGLSEIGLEMNEITLPADSPLIGCSLEELETRGKSAFIVVAVRKPDGQTTIRPSLDLQLESNDTLILMSHIGITPDFVRLKLNRKERFYRGTRH
ncbi:potassium channel protein [Ruficoccus sp. ZRK36]|uniref:potassium channel family protein n=1 Tax=Ruficoccus sp. ZRK36 TaxID=2866311 RepID=UPI001C72DFC2|nr:potassium channel protein [Ruficoccus sp. ZRK36]QYY36276.1 potassium channel protein [Ruficoccus sp. ZRK36]